MQITQPDYYEQFSCIAGDCPDTCCAAWQVVLDEEHAALYRRTQGALGEKMCEGMCQIDGETCFKLKNGRCWMLRDDGLCDIQKELGEAALSQTCGFYPRFVTELGLMRERGLSISCPEVARIILTRTEPTRLLTHSTDEPLRYFHDVDPEDILFAKQTRDAAIARIQERKIPLAKRLFDILGLISEEEPCVFNGFREEMYDVFLSLSPLRAQWTELLQRAKSAPAPTRLDESLAWEQLFCYYIYKYALRAAMDGDFEEKLCLSIVNILLLQDIYSQGEHDLVSLVQLHAKETEHSEENLQLLCEAMAERPAFCAQSLQGFLRSFESHIF